MSKNILLFGLSVYVLFGCSNIKNTKELRSDISPSVIGSGSIKFSVSSMATYRYYLLKSRPKIFVVTTDGERGFYTYCSAALDKECLENTSQLLVEFCQKRSNKSCKVFANNGFVLWRDPGAWENKETVGVHHFIDHRGIESINL